jgi:hypothetical protein
MSYRDLRWTVQIGIVPGLLLALALPARAAGASASPVTFAREIAPIFQEKCQMCHRPDSIAPMSLITYEDVRPWARSIKTRVAARQMPPWHMDKTVGIQHFANDASLSDQQIDTIVKWVDAGAPLGDVKDMPAPIRWPTETRWEFADKFGAPDLVIKSPAWHMPAHAQDAWYKPIVDTGLTESRWVRAIEIRPATLKGRRITHHALARLKQDDGGDPFKTSGDSADSAGGGLFMEWAVGKQGEMLRPNTGKLMMPGSQIIFDIHYHAVGEDITDSVELGIYFYPKGEEPKYRTVLGSFDAIHGGRQALDIAPNSIAVSTETHVMKRAGRIENFQPHMHLRGKAMLMEAILPDGTTRTLSYVNNFQFNWHLNYVYADDAAPILPKGTVLKFTAWHDNTAANKENPDPNQWVGWGERTVDEMAHAWVNITYMSDEDYNAEIAKRNTSKPVASLASR